MTRVPVKPKMLRWACERAGLEVSTLTDRFPNLPEWIDEESHPTFKQLEKFAKATNTPFGFFFLPKPPVENVPIPDLRTLGSRQLARPSANLLDTIYLCQQRQDWYRQHAQLMGDAPLRFIESAQMGDDVTRTANAIRIALAWDTQMATNARNFTDALRLLIERADSIGVLVMVSGIVGSNTHRVLDPDEFRGFALSDALAPLIFVNGADTKAAQMFTIAHELAHLWAGESGVTDTTTASAPRAALERWCNAVAAEVLVPLAQFKKSLDPHADVWAETNRLSAIFRVSTLVVLRRMRDAGRLTREEHEAAFGKESARLSAIMHAKKEQGDVGGDFYRSAKYRLSARFAAAVIASTWEGHSTFTEAFRMLGCRSVKTLENLAHSLGLANPTAWESGRS